MRLGRYPFRAMGGPCELTLYGDDERERDAIAAAGIAEVRRLEQKYSRYRDDSVAAELQRCAGDPNGVEIDDETAKLLDYAETAWRESDGRFDITSGVLRRAWNWKSGALPDPAQVRELLPLVGWSRLRWEKPRLVLPLAGMEVDFGGYVKEYAADRAAEVCLALGARFGMVELAGDLRALGPHPDGSPWRVGIRHPRRPAQAFAVVPLYSGGLATSGDYERFMVVDGVRYSHVLDPRSGWPVEGVSSATVIAPQCLIAGTATTIALLHGRGAGPSWLESLGLPCLWIEDRGRYGGSLAPCVRINRGSSVRSESDFRTDLGS